MSRKSKTKLPFKTLYFLRVKRLTTSFYAVYDYTTPEHTDI